MTRGCERVRLSVWSGDGPPGTLELGEGESVLIGRSPGCGVHLDAPKVSGRHARLSMEEGVLRVEDLESSTGTRVEDQAT